MTFCPVGLPVASLSKDDDWVGNIDSGQHRCVVCRAMEVFGVEAHHGGVEGDGNAWQGRS